MSGAPKLAFRFDRRTRQLAFVVLTSCARPPSSTSNPSGPAAEALGITEYRVLRDEHTALDTELRGTHPGRLTARAESGVISETYVGTDGRFTVTNDGKSLRLDDQVLARRDGSGWHSATRAIERSPELRLLAAVDEDLAVQGSSIIYGNEYVPCTLECDKAVRGLVPATPFDDRCASGLANCVACIEAVP
jgi:hypothetical protein